MNFLLALTLVVAFYMAWNIGANDVANAMGTAVGSKSINLKNALILSVICEFIGAILFGFKVSATMGQGIVDPNSFLNEAHFSLGMLSALLSVSIWLNFATQAGYPVSTTHSMVGAIVGFGIISEGDLNHNRILSIVIGFILSPFIGGVCSYFLTTLLNKYLLLKKSAKDLAGLYFPTMATFVFSIQTLLLIDERLERDFSINFLLIFILLNYLSFYLFYLFYKPEGGAENTFKYLQIIAAAFVALAHGANDVSNSIGPVWGIIGKGGQVPFWLLVFGGIGVGAGVLSKGHQVIDTIGKRIAYLTPSSGFISSFSASIMVLLSSKIGLPISTTHTLIGTIMGVTVAKKMKRVNIGTIKDIFKVWMITIPANFLLCIFIFKILSIFL